MKRVRLAFAPMAALVWSGLMLSGPSFAQPPLNLPNTTITTGTATYQADSITAAQGFTIGGNANVSFAATNPSGSVNLGPGFHAIAGSTFHAFMGTNSVLPGNLSWTANQPVTADGYTFQPFTFSASSTNGAQDLAHYYIIFSPGPTQNAAGGCFLLYTAASNTLELANDANNNWAGAGTVPSSAGASSGVFANSQCKVDLGQSYVSGSGSTLSLKVALYFTPNPNFSGSELIFLNADTNGGFSSDYQAIGVWNVGTPPPPDFTVSVTPTATVLAGGTTAYMVTLGSLNGFTGQVVFASSGLPSGATATFSPSSLNGFGTTVMTVSTASGGATGNFTINPIGTSGTLVHGAAGILVVQDYTLALSSGQTVSQGGTATYTVTAVGINGFNGSISLTTTSTPVNGSPYNGVGAGNSDSSVTASASGTQAIVRLLGTQPGTYVITVAGPGQVTGSTSTYHTAHSDLIVGPMPDFTIIPNQTTQSAPAPGSAAYTLSVSPSYYSVIFGVQNWPSGITPSFGASVNGTTTLTATVAAGTPASTYPLSITGTSGGTQHSLTVNLVVTESGTIQTITPLPVLQPASASMNVDGSNIHRPRDFLVGSADEPHVD